MRYLLLLGASLLLSCKATEQLPRVHVQPVVANADTVATVTSYTVGKKSTVTIQIGTGNTVASATKGPVVAGHGNQVPITTTVESWVRPLLPYVFAAAGLGLVYSLLPLGFAGSGWLWAVLRRKTA